MDPTPSQMRLIDDLCLEFEQAWKSDSADLEEYLQRAPVDCRDYLLRELVAVELHYRVDPSGIRLPKDLLIEAHPSLAKDMVALLPTDVPRLETTIKAPGKKLSDVVLVNQRGSHGLHISCPHCRNAVEVLVDSPFEKIRCASCGSNFSIAGEEFSTGSASVLPTIGRFELLSRLGIGGFGTVWKAKDKELDRIVALKIPRRGQLRPNEVDYFFREARAAAQLKHPHIVAVHELGRDDDTIFIVSDFVEGEPLSEWMAERKLSHAEIARLCALIAEALHHAHLQGVIHRDLKPSNVMIDQDGQPLIMDFGLAKREVGEITMTADGQILGTAAYMSPEQASGQSHWTDCRTDIYSLGVMLFQLTTGELPFRGNLESQLTSKQLNDPPNPRALVRQIPEDLATICLKCLERDPNGRYSTAKQVSEELNRFLADEPIYARPISRKKKAWRWARRRPWTAATLALLTFLATAGPIVSYVIYDQEQEIEGRLDELYATIAIDEADKQKLWEEKLDAVARLDQLMGRVPGIEKHAPDWKLMLIEQIVDANYPSSGKKTILKFEDTLQAAQYHSALGFLFAQLERKEEAVGHLQLAKSILGKLCELHPNDTRLRAALSECSEVLVEQLKGSPASRAEVDQLLELRKQATNSSEHAVTDLFELLEAHWKELGEDDNDQAAFKQMQFMPALSQQILESWPSDPAAIYDAACRLTFRPTFLSPMEVKGDAQE